MTHIQVFQRLNDDSAYHQISVPFAVGWDDVPRRPRGAGLADRIFIRFHVLWPQLALFQVVRVKLPALVRLILAGLQALLLLVQINVQEKL